MDHPSPLREVWLPFLLSRGLLLLVVWLGLVHVAVPEAPGLWRAFPAHPLVDGWARLDSGWLSSVALQGYHFTEAGQNNCGFLPLAPFVARLLSLPLRSCMSPSQAFLLALMALSHLAFLVGLVGLQPMAERYVGPVATRRAIWLLCFFPFSFFFAAAYAEGLHFCLLVWSFRFADEGRWWPACALGALNIWCRIPGFFAAAALAVGCLQANRWRLDRALAPVALLVASFLALSAFFLHVAGTPVAWYLAQCRWRDEPWRLLHEIVAMLAGTTRPPGLFPCAIAVLVLGLAAVVPVARRYSLSWGCLVLLCVAIPASSDLQGLGRYCSVLFPLFILGGEVIARPWAHVTTVLVSGLLMAWFAFQFSHWAVVM